MARGKSHFVFKACAGIDHHRRQAIPIETLGPRFGMTLTGMVVYSRSLHVYMCVCTVYSPVVALMHVTSSLFFQYA